MNLNTHQLIVLREPQANAYQFEQVWAEDAQVALLTFPDVMIDLQPLLL